jgi:hypothetical protein
MEFVVGKAALGQVFLKYFGLSSFRQLFINHYIYPSQHNKLKIVLQHVSAIQPSSGILFLITP